MANDIVTVPEEIDQHIDIALLHTDNRFRFRERLRKDPLFLIGSIIVALSLFLAAFGPHIAPYDPTAASAEIAEPPPALSEWPGLLVGVIRGTNETPPHWLGTDQSGLDVFSRVIAAPRTDITIALAGALLSLALGTILGLIAGFYRNWATEIVMRVSDVLQAFPVFITAMLLVTLSGRSVINIVGNGRSNSGTEPAKARDAALDVGQIVNGLVVGYGLASNVEYYRTHVVGGPSSFVMQVSTPQEMTEAFLAKFRLDVAGLSGATASGQRFLTASATNDPDP